MAQNTILEYTVLILNNNIQDHNKEMRFILDCILSEPCKILYINTTSYSKLAWFTKDDYMINLKNMIIIQHKLHHIYRYIKLVNVTI